MNRERPAPPLAGLAQLRHYERRWLRGDVLAGVTVAAYLIPQVMAYAAVAGLPPVAGLWAVVASLPVYALLGSSRQLSVGPESSTALMTAATLGPLALTSTGRYAALAAVLALLVGVLSLAAWALRLGFIGDLLSRPVLIGYMAGLAVVMIAGQLGKVTGVDATGSSTTLGELSSFVDHAGSLHWPTVALSLTALVLLVGGSRLWPRLPVPLMVVLLAGAMVAALRLDQQGIRVVGHVPAGIPVPALPALTPHDVGLLLLPSLGVAVVGYTDNLLTGRAFAARAGDSVDANQELLALSAANVASSAMHGFPVSSSASRTVIGHSVGSRTQLFSLVALAAVLLTLVLGRGVLARFPLPVLGSLVLWAAARLVDVGEFRRLARFRRSELVLALVAAGGVLAFDLLYGVLVAVALSLLDVLRRVARPHDGVLGYVPGVAGMHDVDDYAVTRQVPGLVVYRYDSPLFFANAENFRHRALAAVDSAQSPTEWLLLNTEANVQVDLTALDALDELRVELERRGIVLALARAKAELVDDLRRVGLLEQIGTDRIFATLPSAVEAYQQWYQDKHGRPPI